MISRIAGPSLARAFLICMSRRLGADVDVCNGAPRL
jgi:hypothetical protein